MHYRWLQDIARDLKHAVRMLRRSPGFAATAIAVLAVGIGANTAVFSVVNRVLLQPLPYPDPDRIIQILSSTPTGSSPLASIPGGSSPLASVPRFVTWREDTRLFEHVAAYHVSDPGVNLTGGDRPERVTAMHVSADYLQLFGAQLAFGRLFTAEDDQPHGPRGAVFSHGLWRRRFGADPELIGRSVWLGRESYEVIGIVGPGFAPDPAADIWLPLQAVAASTDQAAFLHVVARLKPGVTVSAARAEVARTTPLFRRKFPFALGPYESFTAEPLSDVVVGDVKPALQLLSSAVLFVLLIACVNAANLLLARAARRRQELATRAALGAGRQRLIRQLLTESVLLAGAAGLLGLALGYAGVRAIVAVSPIMLPRMGSGAGFALEGDVLTFTLIVSMATGVLFGLVPAFKSSRVDLSAFFKDGPQGGGWRQHRAQSVLVVAEMMLALVLLVGSGLLIRTVIALRSVEHGFDPRAVLTLEMSLNGTQFEETATFDQLVRNAVQRTKDLGIVSEVAVTDVLPLQPGFTLPFTIAGRILFSGSPSHGSAQWRSISREYFDVLRIPRRAGRFFTDLDRADGVPVVIVNQALARKYWQFTSPIGERITVGVAAGPEFADVTRQIVGVVGDVRDADANREPQPTIYVPLAQVSDVMNARNTRLRATTWVARTTADPRRVSGSIARELQNTAGGLPVARIRTMEEIVATTTRRAEFNMRLLTIFASIALVLAMIGMYGLMSYSVQQRTQEIGIRMALGAIPADVRNMVVLQGMRLVLAGVALGSIVALALSRLMVSLIFGVDTWDPIVFGGVASLLTVVAVLAAYIPALRATRVQPLEALRR